MQLQGHRPDVGVEVEEAVGGGAQPLAQVLGVGHGGAESHNPHLALDLRGHVAHARAHHLQHRLQERERERERERVGGGKGEKREGWPGVEREREGTVKHTTCSTIHCGATLSPHSLHQ